MRIGLLSDRGGPYRNAGGTDVKIREDGRVMHQMYLWQVGPAREAK